MFYEFLRISKHFQQIERAETQESERRILLDRCRIAKGFRGGAIVSFSNVLAEKSSLVAAARGAEKCLETQLDRLPQAAKNDRACERVLALI
jgi:hypothetical protein